METQYSLELILLKNYDLQVRDRLIAENKLFDGYHPEMEQVHLENAKRLKEIISEIGFPTISKVGKEGSDAAWLIIQHSISDPKFMKSSYELMLQNKTDISIQNLALLYDRILYFQGKPQKFGTQYDAKNRIFPVENKERLNEFRKEFQLPSIYQEKIDEILPISDIESLENEDPNYIIWRKRVGWLNFDLL